MRKAVVALLAFALAGCSVGDIRRPPPGAPTPNPAPATASARPAIPRAADEVRRAEVPVGKDYRLITVEFGDRDHGFALFIGCDPSWPTPKGGCPAALFGTRDGGRTWQAIRHPHPRADNHQMYVRGDTLILFAEPHGYWFSADGGATFRHDASKETPISYYEAFGRFQACCDGGETRKVVEFVRGRMRPVPTQPPVPSVGPVEFARGTLFAAGLEDGRPYAAISDDRGRTWRPTAVAGGVEGLDMLQILVSSGGEHVWLMGTRSRFGFPSLWLYDGQGWRPSGATGHPLEYLSAAALDDGSVAITGPSGAGIVSGCAYSTVDWPVGRGWIFLLPDGTIFSQVDNDVWLGIGSGVDRRWIEVELSAR